MILEFFERAMKIQYHYRLINVNIYLLVLVKN